jgi:hypothetical protein
MHCEMQIQHAGYVLYRALYIIYDTVLFAAVASYTRTSTRYVHVSYGASE